jgi:penicillin amidase
MAESERTVVLVRNLQLLEVSMRSTVALLACVFGCGCGHSKPDASLSIAPAGTQGVLQVTGPTNFSAVLVDRAEEVTWTLTGGGTLSSTTGAHVVFVPPTGTATETLTATAGGLTASIQIASSPAVLTGATIPGLTQPVRVQYDVEEIPHINCEATADCFAVQGYIQARDRLFPMDFLRHVARSNVSELIGVAGLDQDVMLRTLFITRAGHRLEDDLAKALDPATKALVMAFVGGINAYLAELRTNPAALPGEYAQLPFPITPQDIADWTLEDTMALTRLQQFQLSETIEKELSFAQFAAVYGPGSLHPDSGKLASWIRAAAPVTEQAHTLSPNGASSNRATSAAGATAKQAVSAVPGVNLSPWWELLSSARQKFSDLRERLLSAGAMDASVGSNNWVISADLSATGFTMVANDPHLGLQYPPLFHLAVMTSSNPSDNLNLAGGSFPGIPGALVGRGAHVGWGVTVVGYDVTDLYLEQFLPQVTCPGGNAGSPCVSFKGSAISTLPVIETFMVRVGPGPSGLVSANSLGLPNAPLEVLIVPHHGPIIQAPDASGRALSVRWTGQEGNTQDVKAIFGLNTAVDVDAAVEALKGFSTGAQNFVLADDQGHIAYDPHALVPARPFADTRVVGVGVIPPWFPLPGDGSAEWGNGTSDCISATDTPLPATCWISDAELPHGKDPPKGYFFTANADPTFPSVSDDNNPLAHPPYLSFDWDDSSGFRAARIQELIQNALTTRGSISLEDMEAFQADHASRLGKVFTDYLAVLPSVNTDPPAFRSAAAVLAQWAANGWDCPTGLLGVDPKLSAVDATPSVMDSSAGCFLFHTFLRTLLTNVFADDLAVSGQEVNGLQAIKAAIYMLGLDPTTPEGIAGTTFCRDVNASGQVVATHTCGEQVKAALAAAYETLSEQLGDPGHWIWGRVHTVKPVSLLELVTTNYSPGPFARPGGAFTVDVGTPALSGSGLDFAYTSGGNVRHISLIDPAKPVVKMQLPGPERDAPAIFTGPELLGQWVRNNYFDFAFGDQIESVAVSTQTFTAQ